MSDEHSQHGEHGGGGGGHSGGHGHGGGGHGGGGHAEGEHEGAPEWLISFADNVALMMGFFVILLAMNMGPKATAVQGGEPAEKDNHEAAAAARGLDFVIGVRSAFNNPPSESNPADAELIRRMREREELGETKKPGPQGKKKDLSAVRPSDFVNINALVTFPESTAELSEQALLSLSQAADSLRGTQWIIELRGHVSAAEANRDKIRAMRLAYERSLTVAQYLVEQGVRWEQLRLVECADNDRATPLASTKTQHADNQRVEVVITQETIAQDPYSTP